MPRTASSFLALTLFTLGAARAHAQDVPSHARWHLSGGYTHYQVGGSNGWGDGGEGILYHAFGPRAGGQFRATIIVSSDGFYTFSGVAADLGPTLTLLASRTGAIMLGAGASTLLGGDSDGSVGFLVGGHASLRGTLWIASRVGLYADGTARFWHTGDGAPAISGGITLGL